MYIRQISQKRKDGSRTRYLQLAEKYRDPETGRPKDKILYHFGREDEIDKGQLRRLAKSLTRFLDPSDRLEFEAEQAGVSAHNLVLEKCLAIGGCHVLDTLWKRIGIHETLRKLLQDRAFEVDVERHIFSMVANRALDPRSKLAVERWVGRKVAIDGLEEVAVHNLYRAMDFLIENRAEIERSVFFAVATLLNLEVDLLFFDTTSTYFELEDEDEGEDDLRRYGHSKDKRPDRPQIVIGLAVTRDGIPVRCWVLPGNTADASVVEGIQKDMAGWRLNRVVWVLDRGMTGEKQRIALQRGGGHVIFGEKIRGTTKANAEALARPGRFQVVRDNLEVKEVFVEEGSERRRFVVVRNPKEAERDKRRREETIARLEQEIEQLNRRRRNGCSHSKAVCELKTHRVKGRYVRELKTGELRIDRAKVTEEEKYDGKYLLSSTDSSLTVEDIALGYRQLWQVERAFRTLKTTLELRPLYHRREERVRAHVLLSWLALLLVRVTEQKAGASWDVFRDDLQDISRATLRNDDGVVHLRSELTSTQKATLSALGVQPPPAIIRIAPTHVV